MKQINYRRELPDLMQHLGLPMIAAELGIAEGLNANDFLRKGIEHLYMVDNWGKIEGIVGDGNFENDFHEKNYANVLEITDWAKDKRTILRGLTTEMAESVDDNILGMVYIDAAHDYNSVYNDIRSWWSKLIIGGIMAFHDYESLADTYGVKKAVEEFAAENNLEIHLLSEDKVEDAGAFIIKK